MTGTALLLPLVLGSLICPSRCAGHCAGFPRTLNRYFFSSSVLGDSIGQIRTTNGLGTNGAGVRSLPGLVSHIVDVKSYFTRNPAQGEGERNLITEVRITEVRKFPLTAQIESLRPRHCSFAYSALAWFMGIVSRVNKVHRYYYHVRSEVSRRKKSPSTLRMYQ